MEITEAAQEHDSRDTAASTLPVYLSAASDHLRTVGDGVYRCGVWAYREAGWPGVLPLPPGAKVPPPKGFTGYDGVWPTDQQIAEWVSREPADANLMLRVNYGIIGIDVDAYEAKTGGQTVREAEKRWGNLPLTYRSSARADDVVSGVRIFQVPEGILFLDRIKFAELNIGDIETIQPHHRYITAYPSVHPKTGHQYRWYAPDGSLMSVGDLPCVENLPELPPSWVEALSRNAVRDEVFDESTPNRTTVQRERINEDLYQKLIRLDGGRAPEPIIAARLEKAISDLMGGQGSRYDSTRDHVAALMRYHALGRIGVPKALEQLYLAYVMEVTDTRPQIVAESEFWRSVQGAAALVAATMPTVGEHTRESAEPAGQGDIGDDHPSWGPVDLGPLLHDDWVAPVPTLFERNDGVCLFYPGLVHSVHGESESGKSLILQLESVHLINRSADVLYIDCESDPSSVLQRLMEFGASTQAIVEHFHYVQPETTPNSPGELAAWNEVLAGSYELAVIDGVTDALGISGCSTKDNDDVSRWIREVPKVIASRTGAAVVLIDHVTKDAGTRGRFAIGGQAKMAGLTGAAYIVEVAAPLGRGLRGLVKLRVGKDRPGAVRANCGRFRGSDRTQEAARIIVDSTVSPPRVTVEAPDSGADPDDQPHDFRPTTLMERASAAIEKRPGVLTKNRAALEAGGKKQWALQAVEILAQEGYVKTKSGPSGRNVYESVRPYLEQDDSRSDHFVKSGNASSTDRAIPGSPVLDKGTGEPGPIGLREPLGTNGNQPLSPTTNTPGSAPTDRSGGGGGGSPPFSRTAENQREPDRTDDKRSEPEQGPSTAGADRSGEAAVEVAADDDEESDS